MAKVSSKTSALSRVQRESVRHVQAFKAVFETEQGKLVLAQLMSKFHMISPTYTLGKDINPYDIALQEGQRSVVLFILSTLNIDLEALIERIERNAEIINADE